MTYSESIVIRLPDNYESYARLWMPDSSRGAILYLHGIQSHGGWFEMSAQRLAEAGFAVLLPDRRGSGRNDKQRGHIPSLRQILRDTSEYLDELHVRTGNNQFHVIGVSWGGKLAAAMMQYAPARIKSLTLVGPGLFPKIDLKFTQKLRVGLTALIAKKSLFDIPLNDPKLFTENRLRQEFIANDPLTLHQVTTSFLLASRKMDRYLRGILRNRQGCPLRVFLAGKDRIIDNNKTKDFIRRLSWPSREITEYDEAHHTLEFEPDPEPFFKDLVSWIKQC
ncbi:MAG: alpha/beta fold hydrolase [Planctomycetota bacterium]|nr:MAG: alpha/beta fold hydrolase [Planctomycetota bacterium]